MNRKSDEWSRYIRLTLSIFVVITFVAFLAGQIMFPEGNNAKNDKCRHFEAEWLCVNEDGSTVPAAFPGENDVKAGEWGTVETVLPKEFKETWLCFRSLQ